MADQTDVADPMRERILRATFKVLCRHGYGKFNLSDVAAQAGISRPTLYKSFSSKDELLAAFSEFELQLVRDDLARAVDGRKGRRAARRSAAIPRGLLRLLPDARPHRDRTWLGARPDGRRVARARRVDRAELSGQVSNPEVVAMTLVRLAVCHYLVPGYDEQRLLDQLRAAAGLG